MTVTNSKCVVCNDELEVKGIKNICNSCYDAMRFRKPINLK